jgi:hypothetical protein
LQATETFIHVFEVFNIIAKIPHGRLVYWRQPNGLGSKVRDVIQFGFNACDRDSLISECKGPHQRESLTNKQTNKQANQPTSSITN